MNRCPSEKSVEFYISQQFVLAHLAHSIQRLIVLFCYLFRYFVWYEREGRTGRKGSLCLIKYEDVELILTGTLLHC